MEAVIEVEIVPAVGACDGSIHFALQRAQGLNTRIVLGIGMEAVVELGKAPDPIAGSQIFRSSSSAGGLSRHSSRGSPSAGPTKAIGVSVSETMASVSDLGV